MSTSTIIIIVLGVICALLVGAVAAMIIRTKTENVPSTPLLSPVRIQRFVNTQHNPVYDPHFTGGDEPDANYYQDLPAPSRDVTSPDYLDVQPNNS